MVERSELSDAGMVHIRLIRQASAVVSKLSILENVHKIGMISKLFSLSLHCFFIALYCILNLHCCYAPPKILKFFCVS